MGKKINISSVQYIDRERFKTIIDMHYEEIYLYATNLSRDEDLAKDLVQDVFFKLWNKRRKLKEGVVIKGWLFQSVRHKFIDYIRKYKKENYLFEMIYVEVLNEVVQEDKDNIIRKLKIVEKEIVQLPKKSREVFILSKKEGLKNNEIAKYLNISIKTVEGHLTNAMKILRKKLKERTQPLLILFSHLSLFKLTK